MALGYLKDADNDLVYNKRRHDAIKIEQGLATNLAGLWLVMGIEVEILRLWFLSQTMVFSYFTQIYYII